MKTLYLMRHAKSAPGTAALQGHGARRDHSRPLNQRGRDAVPLVGAHMAAHAMAPQHILCSEAARTQQTVELLLPTIGQDIPTEIRADLYLASTRKLLTAVRKLPDTVDSALLVGHNPGMETMALSLATTGNAQALAKLGLEFPTAGLAVISFDTSAWKKVGPGTGELTAYVLPRELVDAGGQIGRKF